MQRLSRPCENALGSRRGLIELVMPHIAGHDRSQTLLLPESLDDYVGPEKAGAFSHDLQELRILD